MINCEKFVWKQTYCLRLILIVYADSVDSNTIESALSLFSFLVQNADQCITLYLKSHSYLIFMYISERLAIYI
jgi:hypothetical protein